MGLCEWRQWHDLRTHLHDRARYHMYRARAPLWTANLPAPREGKNK